MTKHVITDWPGAPEGWSAEFRRDFAAGAGRGRVGSRLVSETERVRVWHLSLRPGERMGFYTHVLDYFWTALAPGAPARTTPTAPPARSPTRPATPSTTGTPPANA